ATHPALPSFPTRRSSDLRPFVSTDAAVADPREVEIELGYFNLERTRRRNTIATPSMVLNYGFAKRLELVGEFRLEVSPEVEITRSEEHTSELQSRFDLVC